MTSSKINRAIVQGPDKYDLLSAFGDAYSASPKLATFVVKAEQGGREIKHEVLVQGLQHEDGSGTSFNVEGTLVRVGLGVKSINYDPFNRVFIYYRTDMKKGYFRIQHTGA